MNLVDSSQILRVHLTEEAKGKTLTVLIEHHQHQLSADSDRTAVGSCGLGGTI